MSIVSVARRGPIIAVAVDSCVSGNPVCNGIPACKIMPCGKRCVAFACGDAEYDLKYLAAMRLLATKKDNDVSAEAALLAYNEIVCRIKARLDGTGRLCSVGFLIVADESVVILNRTINATDPSKEYYENQVIDPFYMFIPPNESVNEICEAHLKDKLFSPVNRSPEKLVLESLESLIHLVSLQTDTVDDRMQYWMIDLRTGETQESLVSPDLLLPYFDGQ